MLTVPIMNHVIYNGQKDDLLNEDYTLKEETVNTGHSFNSFAINKNSELVDVFNTDGTLKSGTVDDLGNNENVDLYFYSGGKTSAKQRLRALGDVQGLLVESQNGYGTADDQETYKGFITVNNTQSGLHLGVRLNEGDILTAIVTENSKQAPLTYTVVDPNGETTNYELGEKCVEKPGALEKLKVYASKAGIYKIHYTDETKKMTVARITREHSNKVTVTGAVTTTDELSGTDLVFTCNETGEEYEAQITDNGSKSYSVELYDNHTYTVTASDDAYIVSSGDSLELGKDSQGDALTHDISITAVERYELKGEIQGFENNDIEALNIEFKAPEGTTYTPAVTLNAAEKSYSAKLEKGVTYDIVISDKDDKHVVHDYQLKEQDDNPATVGPLESEGERNIIFEKKPTYAVTITAKDGNNDVTDAIKGSGAKIIFTNLGLREDCEFDKDYSYEFNFGDDIKLRDGVYDVKVTESGTYVQQVTSNLVVDGSEVSKEIKFKSNTQVTVEYKEKITVGANENGSLAEGYDYATINEALDAVTHMERSGAADGSVKPVTISIKPGNYEEMLVITQDNIKLVNELGDSASIALKNQGVDIDEKAVRITSYYGHGYNYYSMGDDCKWNADVLEVNKANGYASMVNPGGVSSQGSYWNATVVIDASNFTAEGIIFENSFNQYVSKKASEDIIVPVTKESEKVTPRAKLPAGSTEVQKKDYVERAAALAITNNQKKIYFENCKIIGRQDTLYGGTDVTAGFYKCSIYGSTDYIMGKMAAVFAKCELVLNTNDLSDAGLTNDIAHITAAQQDAGKRGFLMYNCHVTSTTPGVDTASEHRSKAGTFGRPWSANGEALFYYTYIDAVDTFWLEPEHKLTKTDANNDGKYVSGPSMISPNGWNNGLTSTGSVNSKEYGTFEYAKDVDNSTSRFSGWAQVLSEDPYTDANAAVADFLGNDWNPFADKDMELYIPKDDEKVDNTPKLDENVKVYTLSSADWADKDIGTFTYKNGDTLGTKKSETSNEGYFTIVLSDVTNKKPGSEEEESLTVSGGQSKVLVKNENALEISKWGSAAIQFKVTGTADVIIEFASTGGSNESIVGLRQGSTTMLEPSSGNTTVKGTSPATVIYNGLAAGTYSVICPYADASYNRNLRIHSITVNETPASGPQTTEYIFDATTIPGKDANGNQIGDKTVIPSGTTYADDYFKVVNDADTDKAAVLQRIGTETTGSVGETIRVELPKKAQAGIQFRLFGTADVEIEFSSTGASNHSVAGIEDKDGNIIENNEKTRVVFGVDRRKFTYTNLQPGKYRVVSPTPRDEDIAEADNDSMGRSAYLYTIKVTETVDPENMPARGSWDEVAAPTVTAAVDEKDKHNIKVDVTALIDYDGGDKVTVTMLNEDDTPVTDSTGNAISQTSVADGENFTFSFTPGSTGKYKFKAVLSREGCEDKTSTSGVVDFKLPLEASQVTAVTNKGKVEGSEIESGSVLVEWVAVPEAEKYVLNVKEADAAADVTGKDYEILVTEENKSDAELQYLVKDGLTIGNKYTFTVTAYRGEEANTPDSKSKEITADEQAAWKFSVFGTSTSTKYNSETGTAYNGFTAGEEYGGDFTDSGTKDENGSFTNKPDGKPDKDIPNEKAIRVWSEGGKGKIQENAEDGIALFYTEVDPNVNNFRLSGYIHINQITQSGAQESFGIMASDQIGFKSEQDAGGTTQANYKTYTNSYMAAAFKTKYRWDANNNEITYDDITWPQYEMRQGLAAVETTGLTAENIQEVNDTAGGALKKYYKREAKTLETACKNMIGGQYTIFGNYKNPVTQVAQITDLKLTIELNNTGYKITYTPLTVNEDGSYIEGKYPMEYQYYDRDALSKILKDSVYVGFFASRDADVTVTNIEFKLTDPDKDAPAMSRPVTTVRPQYSITSGTTANTSEYNLVFGANWEGNVTIKDKYGKTVVNGARVEDTYDESGKAKMTYKQVSQKVDLALGNNEFTWVFEPAPLTGEGAYNPDPNADYPDNSVYAGFTQLSDYATKTGTFNVTYKKYGSGEVNEALYVSPNGSALGDGTRANPLDIYTAVKYVQPGQVIYLMSGKTDGVYKLGSALKINRGISGTEEHRIYMIPDTDSTKRPVLDFQGRGDGMIIGGDYWYFKGFDVTGSKNREEGVQLSGNYNIMEEINFYKNGNSGLQISRLNGTDTEISDWPSYNLIKNCTSYLNADVGFQDADGFAAKLNVGPGNVFDGCIAAYNADDGWDLFAKPEHGSIGRVTILNSIAYKNGYVRIKDTDGDGQISTEELGILGSNMSMSGIEVPAGNGNGFKMGGNSMPGDHVLKNSIAFYNAAKGIDCNSGPNIIVENSISFNNEKYNVAFYSDYPETDFKANGIISYKTDAKYYEWKTVDGKLTYDESAAKSFSKDSDGENIKPNGEQSNEGSEKYKAIYNDSNYYWLSDAKTANSSMTAVSDAWFENVDFDAFANGIINGSEDSKGIEDRCSDYSSYWVRNEDSSINMHGFLTLTAAALGGGNIGNGTADPDAGTVPETTVPDSTKETNGNISTGNAGNETVGNGVLPEDQDKYSEVESMADAGKGEKVGLWFNIVDPELITYTGKAIKPEIHVYDGTTLLNKKSYSVTYRNNVKAWVEGDRNYASSNKKPTIIVRGKGNYIGMAEQQYFNIYPVQLSDETYIAVKDVTATKASKVKPIITFKGKKLANKRDYEFDTTKVHNNDETLTVNAKAGGNFAGSVTFRFRIVKDKKLLASSFKVNKIPNQRPAGFYDYEKTQPIPVTLSTDGSDAVLKVYNSDRQLLKCVTADSGEDGYSVEFRNNIAVGTASAIITGEGKYAGSKEVKFRIIATPIQTLASGRTPALKIVKGESATATEFNFRSQQYDYTGESINIFEKEGLNIFLKEGNDWTMLRKGIDYTLTYRNNNRAGNAAVVIRGTGRFSGAITKTYRIKPLNLSAIPGGVTLGGTISKNGSNYVIEEPVNFEKGGSRPKIVLLINGNQMDGQYSVTYRNNTWAAQSKGRKPTVIITGRGALRGRLTATFTIQKKSLSDADISITATDVSVSSKDGSGYKGKLNPRIIIKDSNGKVLSGGSDYDKLNITYEAVDNDYIAAAIESGNMPEGTKLQPGSISKGSGRTSIVKIDSDKSVLKVKATVKALEGTNGRAASCGYSGSISTYFYVGYARKSIRNARIVVNYGKDSKGKLKRYFDYTGEEITLFNEEDVYENGMKVDVKYLNDVTVTVGGTKLVYGKDFELLKDNDGKVVYTKNINKGTASVTIRGIGEYSGTRVIKYRIGAQPFEWDSKYY